MSEIDYGLPFRELINDRPLSLDEAIAQIIASLRRQVLSELIQNLMSELERENYHFDEVIDALGDYAYTKPEWGSACKCLEEAAEALLELRKPRRHPI